MHKLLLSAACGALIVSGPVHAQFGELLKNAVTNAATNAATSAAAHATTNAVNGAIRGATSPSAPPPPAAQHAGSASAPLPETAGRGGCESTRKRKPLAPLGPRPANFPAALWPAEPACVYGFEDYDFTVGQEQAKAFDQAGRVACSECAGGFSHDANAQGKLAVSGGLTKRFLEMLVTMRPGEKIEWKGARYRGAITLAGELPIGEFPCRQFHWTLTSKADVVMAEREGLYCIWKHRSDDPVWTKVL
ncbi:hypothetical protein [Pseudoduganella albidiflava]|uniref:Uncharacterized protein n=1 Tax=Pseudoduganella albidiflava TaxID=321983 RepID=A0A411X446_9BURK|nr:hypothetical protein [Pseudoduganella albidiflava]QBI03615.1 hypothetical protein EYF70_24380 [Pseudoduganella albidiflava]GGY51442.1 hypothetical protein GCM10007387_37300 [Pseudoduganella albidiflava]